MSLRCRKWETTDLLFDAPGEEGPTKIIFVSLKPALRVFILLFIAVQASTAVDNPNRMRMLDGWSEFASEE